MDNKQGVCLFYQRTGTCKLGDQCPLSHVREERGITTKYDDRIWQHAQVAPVLASSFCPSTSTAMPRVIIDCENSDGACIYSCAPAPFVVYQRLRSRQQLRLLGSSKGSKLRLDTPCQLLHTTDRLSCSLTSFFKLVVTGQHKRFSN